MRRSLIRRVLNKQAFDRLGIGIDRGGSVGDEESSELLDRPTRPQSGV